MSTPESSSFSIYDLATGAIVACVTAERGRGAVAPPGCGVVQGRHDGRCRRVNLQTGEVEAFQPEKPDDDHEWDAATEEWKLPQSVVFRRAAIASAHRQIADLEARQARAIREHAIGRGGTPAQLKKRLEDIDDQITALRAQLT